MVVTSCAMLVGVKRSKWLDALRYGVNVVLPPCVVRLITIESSTAQPLLQRESSAGDVSTCFGKPQAA